MADQTTRWDRAREITEQMLRLQAELKREWPGRPLFFVSESLVSVEGGIAGLRQVAIAGQDTERVEKYGSEARRV